MMAALLSSWWSGKSPEGEKEGEESKADSWSTGIGSEKPPILNCVDIIIVFLNPVQIKFYLSNCVVTLEQRRGACVLSCIASFI